MRIFVTGASGFIGGAVARAFARRGHEVRGLTRGETRNPGLRVDGVIPVTGDLNSPESVLALAARSEVFVHCAHEYSAEAVARDNAAIEIMLALAKQGGPRGLVYTSGVWVYGNCCHDGIDSVDEASPLDPLALVGWRPSHEARILEAAGGAVRAVVIRPGCVYGGAGSLTGNWFASALKEGAAVVAGDGRNRWAMVHLDDLADLYVRAAEREVSGVFNGSGVGGVVAEMAAAAAVAAGASGRIKILDADKAREMYGPLAEGLMASQAVRRGRAERLLDWHPRHRGFAENAAVHFASWRAAQNGEGKIGF